MAPDAPGDAGVLHEGARVWVPRDGAWAAGVVSSAEPLKVRLAKAEGDAGEGAEVDARADEVHLQEPNEGVFVEVSGGSRRSADAGAHGPGARTKGDPPRDARLLPPRARLQGDRRGCTRSRSVTV